MGCFVRCLAQGNTPSGFSVPVLSCINEFRFDRHVHGSFPGKNRKMPPTAQVQKDAQVASSLSVPAEVLLASSYISHHGTGSILKDRAHPDNSSDDRETGDASDIRYGMMQLHIHLHQRFLHMLNMRSPVFSQAFSLPQIRPED